MLLIKTSSNKYSWKIKSDRSLQTFYDFADAILQDLQYLFSNNWCLLVVEADVWPRSPLRKHRPPGQPFREVEQLQKEQGMFN